ncbi:MAG TPA: TetR/AcrR family transcriptional regulator [Cytophagales bacterium]|nr:TetR/AcrR family transcriptional regulator [Cytophagales bacterium]
MKEATRDIILNVSKKLFNENGYYNVSLRQIANEIGISQGNLNYHFKKKEELLKELYNQFGETLTKEFVATSKISANFYLVFELARKTYEIQNEYIFFFNDRLYLANDIPQLRTQYHHLKVQRIKEFNLMFIGFIEKGDARAAEYESEYEDLGLRLYLLGIYAMSDLRLEIDLTSQDHLKRYLQIITSAFFPYLTSQGKKKYFETLQDYDAHIK